MSRGRTLDGRTVGRLVLVCALVAVLALVLAMGGTDEVRTATSSP